MKAAGISTTLFLFWIVLIGTWDPKKLAIGTVLCVSLGWWSARLVQEEGEATRLTPGRLLALLGSTPAFAWHVLSGGVQVAIDAFRPTLALEPRMVECDTGLEGRLSQALYVSTVTLSPGTLAVDSEGQTTLVHCLSERFAADLDEGVVERRIARALEE